MAYLVEPVITPQSDDVVGEFQIKPGNYRSRLDRKLSNPSDLPREISILTGAAAPDAFSLGSNYLIVSPALRYVINAYPNTGIDYLPLHIRLLQVDKDVEYYLADRIPQTIRMLHEQCKFRRLPGQSPTDAREQLMPSNKVDEITLRKQSNLDPHVWSEGAVGMIDKIYLGEPGAIFFSNELWRRVAELFPLAFHGRAVRET